jgi:hypothetical protein
MIADTPLNQTLYGKLGDGTITFGTLEFPPTSEPNSKLEDVSFDISALVDADYQNRTQNGNRTQVRCKMANETLGSLPDLGFHVQPEDATLSVTVTDE